VLFRGRVRAALVQPKNTSEHTSEGDHQGLRSGLPIVFGSEDSLRAAFSICFRPIAPTAQENCARRTPNRLGSWVNAMVNPATRRPGHRLALPQLLPISLIGSLPSGSTFLLRTVPHDTPVCIDMLPGTFRAPRFP